MYTNWIAIVSYNCHDFKLSWELQAEALQFMLPECRFDNMFIYLLVQNFPT